MAERAATNRLRAAQAELREATHRNAQEYEAGLPMSFSTVHLRTLHRNVTKARAAAEDARTNVELDILLNQEL